MLLMTLSKAKLGWHTVDEKRVHTDSKMEAVIIKRLVKNGFSGKWRRPGGSAFGRNQYTPDLELAIIHDSQERHAFIEIKPTSATQFSMKDRRRAFAALHGYSDFVFLLYVHKTRRWYEIDPTTKYLAVYPNLTPGNLTIDAYKGRQPGFTVPVINKYGRSYASNGKAHIAGLVANGLEVGMRLVFGGQKKLERRK